MNFPRCRGIHADTLPNVQHPDLRADYVLANGSISSNQSGEGDIRRDLIEADLLDCMVTLPGQLFYNTQIPVCLWFSGKMNPLAKPAPCRNSNSP